MQAQNYQLWQRQPEALAPVIGDGLLGGKNRCWIALRYSQSFLDCDCWSMFTVFSCSGNEHIDPCSRRCGHVSDGSWLPAGPHQPACHTGRPRFNTPSLHSIQNVQLWCFVRWLQKYILISSLSLSHQLLRPVDAAQQIPLLTPTAPAVVCAARTVNATGEISELRDDSLQRQWIDGPRVNITWLMTFHMCPLFL